MPLRRLSGVAMEKQLRIAATPLVFSRSQGTGCAVHRSLTEPTQLVELLKGERSDECPEGQTGHNDAQQRNACLYRAGAVSDRAIGEW